MILKYADMLASPDFGMPLATKELREWVTATRKEVPELSVKHCAFFPRHPSVHLAQPLVASGSENDAPGDSVKEAEGLEVPAAQVVVCERKSQAVSRKRKLQEDATAKQAESEASFKSSTVMFLMKQQDFNLAEASKIADVAWRKKQLQDATRSKPGPATAGPKRRSPLLDAAEDGSDHEVTGRFVKIFSCCKPVILLFLFS